MVPGTGKPAAYCVNHREEGMVNNRHKPCIFFGCRSHATFKEPGGSIPVYCAAHRSEVDLSSAYSDCPLLFFNCGLSWFQSSQEVKMECLPQYLSKVIRENISLPLLLLQARSPSTHMAFVSCSRVLSLCCLGPN